MEKLNVELETESVIDDINSEISTENTEILTQENMEVSTQSIMEVSSFDSQTTSDIELLISINTYITIICIVVVIWFCSWLMRSWRTWTSKIGRRL